MRILFSMPRSQQDASPAPVWARAEPAAKREPLNRDRVVACGIRIADAEGLSAVSMRRVATELDARTMSLYRHVPSKNDLLDLMFDQLARDASVGAQPSDDWRDGLRVIARRTRKVGLAHPWSIDLLGQRAQLGPGTMRLLDEWVGALIDLPVPVTVRWAIVTAVNDYVVGFVVRENAHRKAVPTDKASARRWQRVVARYLTGLADSGEFPHIEELLRSGYAGVPVDFDDGLGWLIDSIATQYGSPAGKRRARRSTTGH
ncbi:MAG: hypothetical protein JWN95_4044 [Frankiales bacterium]|nr:hypothetical protein [Frankiales bacterium]